MATQTMPRRRRAQPPPSSKKSAAGGFALVAAAAGMLFKNRDKIAQLRRKRSDGSPGSGP